MTRSRHPLIVVVGNGMVGHHFCRQLRDTRGGDLYRLVVFGEEPHLAYDRVHLTSYLTGASVEELQLADRAWYARHEIELLTGERVVSIDRAAQVVRSERGRELRYDLLVLATGSAAWVPPVPGLRESGAFVYRTIDDLDRIREAAARAARVAVLGGGLLGLEAARALLDLGLETHVVEMAPHLMARQLDATGGELLARRIAALGVRLHLGRCTERVERAGGETVLCFRGGERLAVDLVVISAGIRPRDELASACGLELGPRGGVAVDDRLQTSDRRIFAAGECASFQGTVYGLVAPGLRMADVLAARLCGIDQRFRGADLSCRLKLLGVDVATVGESTAPDGADITSIALRDDVAGTYRKLILRRDRRTLVGAVLVGDTRTYGQLLALFRAGRPLPDPPLSVLAEGLPLSPGGGPGADAEALLCTCNGVTRAQVAGALEAGASDVAAVKAATRAGTGCGGCVADIQALLDAERRRRGETVARPICAHFPLTRQDLFLQVRARGLRTFPQVLASCGQGADGCEICKPAVASILASQHNEPAIEHATIQDTNDRFLANIQRGGTYSVVPRIPGGEITPEKLIVLGQVAQKYDLYVKITGGQRIDLFGARLDQLPDIWEELVAAGFESGHAYAKAMRTVKSCVGSTWCRFGQLDSVAFAIRIENRYKGLRAPHKLKAAVSGCIRECAEARSKDFGVIATAEGWNLYVCGNGGAQPRHAELLAAGLDDDTCIRFIDRFLMLYIRTADPLMRTARWLDRLEGGIDYLRKVIVEDSLGIGQELEDEIRAATEAYQCEWAAVVRDPEKRRWFRSFVNAPGPDPTVRFARERGQKRPLPPQPPDPSPPPARDSGPVLEVTHA